MSRSSALTGATEVSAAVPALRLEGISKRFGAVQAITDMTFEVRRHEVVGLLGENGAGKSTLLKILVGLVEPDTGTMYRDGQQVRFRTVTAAADAGIGMVYQEQSLVPSLTVAENILLGCEGHGVTAGVFRWRKLRELAQAQLDKIGSDIPVRAVTSQLTFPQRQMVEIAKVLSIEERTAFDPVVLLDEPTSVLDGPDVAVLFEQIERLRERASVVLVSHRIEEVMAVADRIYVLRNGVVAAERRPTETTTDELRHLMIGREDTGSHFHAERQADCADTPRLEIVGLSSAHFHDVNITVRKGEVVGLAGVQGSGREELCRAIFGALKIDAGEIILDGEKVKARSPRGAVQVGIGYLPAERRTEGMIGTMSVAENMSLATVGTVCRGPVLDREREKRVVDDWIERLRIRTPSGSVPMRQLSGGNQQKVVLARWLMSGDLKVLLLDHPTRGLDVGAKSEVYALVRDLAANGVSLLVLCDGLDETIALGHRVIVMRDGEVSAEFAAVRDAKPRPDKIMEHML